MVKDLYNHPLVQHHLTVLRNVETEAPAFRSACSTITQVLVAEAAKELELDYFEVQTPLEPTEGGAIKGRIVFVPILRAGLGMLDHAMATIPGSSVGYIGMERDEETAVASCYYAKMPDLAPAEHVFVLDPMLATGGSAAQCIDQLKQRGARHLTMVCIISCPEGVEHLRAAHPDVRIVTGKIDRALNEKAYILPGLGDFGDRLFNT